MSAASSSRAFNGAGGEVETAPGGDGTARGGPRREWAPLFPRVGAGVGGCEPPPRAPAPGPVVPCLAAALAAGATGQRWAKRPGGGAGLAEVSGTARKKTRAAIAEAGGFWRLCSFMVSLWRQVCGPAGPGLGWAALPAWAQAGLRF